MTEAKEHDPLLPLLEVIRAMGRGDYSRDARTDGDGTAAQLAQELNTTIRRLRDAQPKFCRTADQITEITRAAQHIAELMEHAAQVVLDAADDIVQTCDQLEMSFDGGDPQPERLERVKQKTFDIIAVQSYQDTAKQKLQKLEQDLAAMRSAMGEALIQLPLRPGEEDVGDVARPSPAATEAVSPSRNEARRQDLVDQLLAEFGL